MPEGVQALSFAFWREVQLDLLAGDWNTKLWLTSRRELGGFLWWCDATNKRPAEWRADLLKLYAMKGTAQGARAAKRIRDAK